MATPRRLEAVPGAGAVRDTPLPGTRHRLSLGEKPDVVTVDILEDDATTIRIGLADAGEQTGTIEIAHPLAVDSVEILWNADLGTERLLRGGLHLAMHVEFGHGLPRAHGELSHRLLRGSGTVTITGDAKTWRSAVEVDAHARGWLRPFAALAALVFGRRLRIALATAHAEVASHVDDFNAGLMKRFAGQPSSEQLASTAMDDLVAALA